MEQLLTPKQLGEAIGLAVQSVYNRFSTGGDLPPALKIGRALRFRASDVEIWLASKIIVVAAPLTPQPVPQRRRPGRPTKAEQKRRENEHAPR